MNPIEWKWSNGEESYKSPRLKEQQLTKYVSNNDNEVNPSQNAIMQSLNGYDSFDFETMFSRNDNASVKMREELDDKISSRELIFQRGTNPFLQTTNYVNDIIARDTFLKPKNTTFEKIKNVEE
jgi:hypothetical protein